MTDLTVACVLVRGHVGYEPIYVEKLSHLCQQFIERPFRFVCLTDQPKAMPRGVEPIPIKTPQGIYAWWAKIKLFDPSVGITGRALYLDLDNLPVANLEPVISFPAPFALIPHAGTFNGKDGLEVIKRYNSSVMVWDEGEGERVWSEYTGLVPRRLWGDQDWIASRYPDEATFPLSWFPRLSEVKQPPWPADAKVILVKKPKPHVAARCWPWFRDAWDGRSNIGFDGQVVV